MPETSAMEVEGPVPVGSVGVWEAPDSVPRGATALPPKAVGARGLAARRGGAMGAVGEAGGRLGEE